ncbi:5'-methylthioadenosine/S-adenosylhomocysteine nucleosidase [Bacillus mycoides]|uniref:5'-methylthioadenosine/S-adenosylhomocysteine nucleosidase n=1 Tax=Bacillus TaxID=1386 RepID=UPI000DC22229|nr:MULTISPECIES: 5'-methylthioadenosine/S-adenosylhomocysteine nucleosidase [Bacillus]MBJ7960352.1 5'-methylthioadenosine/S-adenosylhomocysteine nucleosidase [Bacillus cereus group sp. N28]MDI6531027.1 5'-methylthioadenosine/S-adenosylhomocysteine nucleosidase [Bacillus mycoides]RAN67147.1 5'-methylthioadenosine nucleosidase [Bacillus sp. SRB_8]WJE56490.1 5'-methylthioadenosine/S-adenosylhomocysteine nucleosidase [Bacillus mycoides]WJE62337.1 5'-methylthioadenosine/S-adenosylhomocysteine nucle
MKKNTLKKCAALVTTVALSFSILAGCNVTPKQVEAKSNQNPILIQGPMPIEAEKFAKRLKNVKEEKSGSFVFYKGTVDNYPVIVAKTGKGMENTAAATAVAIEKYKPIAIINQGTSGGHDPNLNVFDIVLGKQVANIGSLKTTNMNENQGIEPEKWISMDLMASEGSAGEDPNAEKIRYYEGDKDLLAAANAVKDKYTKGKVVEGTIGSADVWNNEVDRIKWFHTKYGTSVEEMEGAAAAQIAKAYDVPFLGIRVLSNNKTNGGKYNPNTAAANQEYVYEVVKKYIDSIPNK